MKKLFTLFGSIFISWIIIVISPFIFSGVQITDDSASSKIEPNYFDNITIVEDDYTFQPEVITNTSTKAVSSPTTWYFDINDQMWMNVENDGTNQADVSFNFYLEDQNINGTTQQVIKFEFNKVDATDFTAFEIAGIQFQFALSEADSIQNDIDLLMNLSNYAYVQEGETVSYTNPYQYNQIYVSVIIETVNPSNERYYYVGTNYINLGVDLETNSNDKLVAATYEENPYSYTYEDTSITSTYSFVPNYDLYPDPTNSEQQAMVLDFLNVYYYNGNLWGEAYDNFTSSYQTVNLKNSIVLTWSEVTLTTNSRQNDQFETINLEEGLFSVNSSIDFYDYQAETTTENIMVISIPKITSSGLTKEEWFVEAFSKLTMENPYLTQEQKYGNWGQNPAYTNTITSEYYYVPGVYSFNMADSTVQVSNPHNEYFNELYLPDWTIGQFNLENLTHINNLITYQTYNQNDITATSSSTVVPYSGDVNYVVDPAFAPSTSSTGLFWYWWLLIALAILFVALIITSAITIPLVMKKNKVKA